MYENTPYRDFEELWRRFFAIPGGWSKSDADRWIAQYRRGFREASDDGFFSLASQLGLLEAAVPSVIPASAAVGRSEEELAEVINRCIDAVIHDEHGSYLVYTPSQPVNLEAARERLLRTLRAHDVMDDPASSHEDSVAGR